MTALHNHLEQISLSSAAIAELSFPPPKIFTNALLHSHDITALIRDTEIHERALFTLAPSDPKPRRSVANSVGKGNLFSTDSIGGSLVNESSLRKTTRNDRAVAMLLGGDVMEQMRRDGMNDGRERGEVNVEIFPIPGAVDKIASLRTRFEQLSSSVARYESRISKQSMQLDKINREKYFDMDDNLDNIDDETPLGAQFVPDQLQITAEDLRREEEEIRELEKKKRALEERVSGMERDLGGLLR
ncbi:hypothetical protein MMC12_002603 [Toensbergia leucococca]|nr:hypothetical protein [Toensbergia leucococca]